MAPPSFAKRKLFLASPDYNTGDQLPPVIPVVIMVMIPIMAVSMPVIAVIVVP
jgi:hypothetical protein